MKYMITQTEVDFGTEDPFEIRKILNEKTAQLMQYYYNKINANFITCLCVNQKILDNFFNKSCFINFEKNNDKKIYHMKITIDNGLSFIFLSSDKYRHIEQYNTIIDVDDNKVYSTEEFYNLNGYNI